MVLVTGGSGFLGSHIVNELFEEGSPLGQVDVRVLDINAYKGEHQVDFFQGDVRDYEEVKKACTGVDAVIHSAAVIDWGTHSPKYVYDVNTGGTENVIRACRELGIRNLVYTSSLDALYTGKPLRNVNDHQTYPEHFHNMYCKSKVVSEQRVMAANGPELKATILRPCDIYGPTDPYHMNALIGMAKTGFYVKIGSGNAKTQHIFVGNMAYAHVLALAELMKGNEKIPGQAYLITDSESANFFDFFTDIVAKAGYRIRPKNARIPWVIAYPMGAVSEFIAFLVRPFVRYNPGLSRFAVNYTCTDYTFKSDRAKEHFGFKPKYSEEEAVEMTAAFYRKN